MVIHALRAYGRAVHHNGAGRAAAPGLPRRSRLFFAFVTSNCLRTERQNILIVLLLVPSRKDSQWLFHLLPLSVFGKRPGNPCFEACQAAYYNANGNA